MGIIPGNCFLGFFTKTVWLLLAIALLLIWPALINGQYFWFSDSIGYLSEGSRVMLSLGGLQSEIGAALNETSNLTRAAVQAATQGTGQGISAVPETPVIYGGRSPYYGLLLYLPTFVGGLWLSVLVQVAAVILCVVTALRPIFGPDSLPERLIVVGIVAVVTSIGFFTVYLMPDIFMAILILSTASLVAFWSDHTRGARVLLLALIFSACLFHKAHLVMLFGMLVLLGGYALLARGRPLRPAAPFVAMAVVLACAGVLTAAVPWAAMNFVGAKILNTPFLTARVVTDGPGEDYLRATCPQSGYVLCDHLDRLPQGMDQFLWSTDGVYKELSLTEQIAMSEEQTGFVLAAVAHAPLDQIGASAGNVVSQLLSIDVTEFALFDGLVSTLAERLPGDITATAARTRLANDTLNLHRISQFQAVVVIAASIHLAVFLTATARTVEPAQARLAGFVLILVLGLVLNAIVFGTLSEPHDRYQSRIIWFLPLASLVVIFTSRRKGRYQPST